MSILFTCHPFSIRIKGVIAAAGLLVLGIALLKNYIFLPRYLFEAMNVQFDWSEDVPPGRQFLVFSPMLQNVPAVGYYTDSYGPDFWYTSSALVEYQRAQAALAPTLLDAEEPFRHDWVFFVCNRKGCENGLMRMHDLDIITRVDGRITLGHAKKGRSE
jgi:hypothetical protein